MEANSLISLSYKFKEFIRIGRIYNVINVFNIDKMTCTEWDVRRRLYDERYKLTSSISICIVDGDRE